MKKIFTLGLTLLSVSAASFANDYNDYNDYNGDASPFSYQRFTVLNSTETDADLQFHMVGGSAFGCGMQEITRIGKFKKRESDRGRSVCLLKSIAGKVYFKDEHDKDVSHDVHYDPSAGTTFGTFIITQQDLDDGSKQFKLKHMTDL